MGNSPVCHAWKRKKKDAKKDGKKYGKKTSVMQLVRMDDKHFLNKTNDPEKSCLQSKRHL